MRGRSPGCAATICKRLRELPRARRIFPAIERRLENFLRQLAPFPVRYRIETRKGPRASNS
jgi:hypothetical protein